MTKQAVKKGSTITKKGISAFKSRVKINPEEGNMNLSMSNANKPQDWILMPKSFVDATKINIPQGCVISVIGHSNVGKSTLINHAIVSAQKQGIIPVIIDTENAFSFQYAMNMGFQATPIYGIVETEVVNPETGEVGIVKKNEIVHWDGDFIYYNNNILCERFGNMDYSKGTVTKTKRTTAVVEDVAAAINEILDAQDEGEIDNGILFVWDSVGSIGSFKEVNACTGGAVNKIANPQWTAAGISTAMNQIVNHRIPGSKKLSSKYTNTLLYINKVWMDSMTNPVGPPIMQTKGGKSMKYATRLEILMGGQLTSGVKRLTATSKGITYSYGIQTKVKVLKNHLDAPHNVCYEGNLIACDFGFIGLDELEQYKKDHISDILQQLNKLAEGTDVQINEDEIEFVEVDDEA